MTWAEDPSDVLDALIAVRAAGEDERAFAVLVQRHRDAIYRLLRRYLGNPDEAYDAAQETFIAAWLAIGRYDPSRSFGVWLRTIALNKARDRARRAAFRRLIFGDQGFDDNAALAAPDPTSSIEDAITAQQELSVIDRALFRLPKRLKEPLLLTALEGLSQQETSVALGISVKAVETRVYRARKLLLGALQEIAPRTRANHSR